MISISCLGQNCKHCKHVKKKHEKGKTERKQYDRMWRAMVNIHQMYNEWHKNRIRQVIGLHIVRYGRTGTDHDSEAIN